MKTAMDYAQQALRFVERVTDDVDALRADWQQAMKDGRRMARGKRLRAPMVAQHARIEAGMAARSARQARGWWREEYAAIACSFACGAAWYAGFAEA